MLNQKIQLKNGVQIPTMGLGTWQIPDEIAQRAVKDAISVGYKHIDTAVAYGNESGVGRGIKESGIKREDVFITSKVLAECKDYALAKESIEQSLKRLNTDYIDLMLIHAPRPWDEMIGGAYSYDKENVAVYKALEEGYKEGKLRAIGVSNFSINDLKNIQENCEILPHVNQICCFAGEVPLDIIEYCKQNGIVVEAYSPIGTGRLLKNEKVADVAKKYGVSVAQLCIKFDLQLGLVVLPKSTHKEYMQENASLNFVISDEDMRYLITLA
ncbi:MAG: aldo/keto reductase [Clostridia bacterium]|nr:aldo/keto reductase [Clostridia bacterium]